MGISCSRAWRIAWKYKVLWLYGFLVSLFFRLPSDIRYEMLPREMQRAARDFVTGPNFLPYLVRTTLFFMLISLGISVLKAIGRSALAHLVDRAEAGETPTVQAGWTAARRYGWRVFWLAFLLGLPVLVVMLIGLAPFVATLVGFLKGATNPLDRPSPDFLLQSLACFAPFCCFGAALGLFLGVINAIAERAVVLEDRSIRESIAVGWRLLRENSGAVLVLWVILAVIHFGVFSIVFLPLMLTTAPLIAGLVIGVKAAQELSPWVFISGYLCISAIFWLVFMFVGSVTEPFFSGCWTLAYRQWTGEQQAEVGSDFSGQVI